MYKSRSYLKRNFVVSTIEFTSLTYTSPFASASLFTVSSEKDVAKMYKLNFWFRKREARLVENLNSKQIPAEYTNFPDRNTEVGKAINNYLTSKSELPDEAIHLLFSSNRWEKAKYILKTLEQGTSIVIDRYCYSGVAFSAAKGLEIKWCKSSDAGLPRPDKVFFLTMPLEIVQQRNGFGNERYEVLDFQKKVSEMYKQLHEDNWEDLDASRSIQEIQEELLKKTINVVNDIQNKSIEKIWLDLRQQQ